ncbi:hypothetical protein [Erythrobacter litoralis]|uniref:Uncharacterized protein n=1 Tax=Erythrobacter litoralis (strain HTCC2594) TaxID=314225 RepID=Q2NDD9_ERYLH|nr:hypothetical protein [Erythrobacter litoralis]ABC62302.1 hypothetical protein ELI_01050 [Erythrobacter litoralis HTCC2594]
MNEASFASLNPSLLARKGGAKPAMRPQLAPLNPNGSDVAANLEDLGWNDMGDESEADGRQSNVLPLTPEPANEQSQAEARQADRASDKALHTAEQPVIRKQQQDLAERVAEPAPPKRPTRTRRSALDRGKRAAFTLRLDAERHLKLRLASTVRGASAQAIVTEALDKLLDDMPELSSIAAQVQRR